MDPRSRIRTKISWIRNTARNLSSHSLIFDFYNFYHSIKCLGISGPGGWNYFGKKARRGLLTGSPIHLNHFWSTSIFMFSYRHRNTVHKKCLPASMYLSSRKVWGILFHTHTQTNYLCLDTSETFTLQLGRVHSIYCISKVPYVLIKKPQG